MPTYPLPTLAPVVTSTGISAPTYVDILASLQASFKLIYGADAYLEADSQDGQWLAIIALAIYDSGQASIAVYNAFSPATAVGAGLSSVVKINHLARLVASRSAVNVTIVGVAGTVITSGVVSDVAGNKWDLPATVTVPVGGSIVVTATAQTLGAIQAQIGTVSTISTPTAGWQTATNASAAAAGLPVETDATLRSRQELAPAIASYTPMAALVAAIQAITGVTYGVIYENDTNTTDANGVPAHSLALVVKGGDATVIAQTLFDKKSLGVGTYGTTTINITDASGTVRPVKFFVPTQVPIKVTVTLHPIINYTTAISNSIKQAVVDFINGLSVNEDLVVSRLYGPALLVTGSAQSETYAITSITAALAPAGVPGTADIVTALNEKATCLVADVTITLV